jgi:hypothetical protein
MTPRPKPIFRQAPMPIVVTATLSRSLT